MRKTGIKSRILTACLAAAMMLSSGTGFKAGVVNAASAGISARSSEAVDSEVITVQEEELEQDKSAADKNDFKKSNLKINFTVVENSKLTTPTKKSYVVVDLGKDGDKVENPVLVLEKTSNGKQYKFRAKKTEGTSLLFYPEFTDDSYTGIYKFKSIQYTSSGIKYEKLFEDEHENIRIGVNKDPMVTPDGYLTDSSGSEAQQLLESDKSVKSLSSNVQGTTMLGFAGVNKNIAGKASINGNANNSSAVRGSNAPGNIVIVLDPGHGGLDPGTNYTWNGKHYEERTISQKLVNYCKEYLEKYEGVTVFLTRSSTAEPERADDLTWRCKFAYEKGADILISFHCNAAGVGYGSPANGACVYVPNENYNYRAYNVGKKVGASIGKKLKQLGLADGSTRIWNTEKDARYPDGSPADYLAIVKHCKEYGIPGILIEHGYLSNATECEKFFSTEEKIKKMAKADAEGIAENIGLIQQNRSGTNSNVAGWQQAAGYWYYYDQDGNVKTGFFKVKGKTYYGRAQDGRILTGWQLIDGNWYCFNKRGAMYTKSWQVNSNGKYSYLAEDGKMAIGITKTDKGYYYFNADGDMQTGWQKINKNWYYMDKSGLMYRGRWLNQNGKTYYLKVDGRMATGLIKKGKKRYYLNSNGERQYGWQYVKDNWYYFESNGKAKADSWMTLGGKEYYFNSEGKMAVGPSRVGKDMYFFAKSGEKLTGWNRNGKFWYLSDSTGKLKINTWYTENKKKYYFDENAKMVTGKRVINDKTYTFNSNGQLVSKKTNTKKNLHSIMSKSKYTAESMAQRYKDEGKRYPVKNLTAGGAKNIDEFCQIIVEEAEAEGVSAEIVFAQIMHETGWLQFGGDVKVSQYNFCGLGAVGGGEPGCSFPDVRTGIRAQVQHLKAYASTEPLKNTCVDPRFQYVERGCAKYVEYLGIQENPKQKGWATDPGYGTKLLNIVYTLKK